MMGPMKASVIRAELRKAFKMTDADLFAWFNRQIEERTPAAEATSTDIETLRLLCDALIAETQRSPRRPKKQQATLRNRSAKSVPATKPKTVTSQHPARARTEP
jgi:hypothetical protein